MKKILLNIAFMAILGSIGLAYTTDIDADDLNVNHFSKLPNKLKYRICQDSSFKDNITLGMVDKEWHNITNAFIDLNFSKLKLFGNQSYIIEKLYSYDEIEELQNLALEMRRDVKAVANGDLSKEQSNAGSKPIQYNDQIKAGLKANLIRLSRDRGETGAFIRKLYMFDQNVLEFAQHENMLNTVSQLLGCPASQVHHKKNDIIYDRYEKFIGSGAQIAKTTYNELGTYKLNFCLERDKVDAWQANSFNSCYVNAMTLLSPCYITVDVWKDAMSIKSSKQAREFRKTYNPNESIVLKPGDTILWHPYTEISFRPKNIWSDEICILSNGFAHPTVTRKVNSTTIPRLKPCDIAADNLNVNHFSKLPNELMDHTCQDLSFKDTRNLSRTDKTFYKNADDLNVNHFSKLPNELIYHIYQDLSLKDILNLSRTNKTFYKNLDVKFFFSDRFRRQSYISLNFYSPDEFKELQNLSLEVCCNINKIVNGYLNSKDEPIKKFSLPEMASIGNHVLHRSEIASVRWSTEDKNSGFIRNLHLYKKNVLEFAQHENMLNAASKLLGCSANQVCHKKNDIIYDKIKEFIVHDTHTARTAYNELGLYKRNFCEERDIVNKWQANSFNCCYINAMTLISPYDIIVDVWKKAMLLNSATASYQFRKTHNPDESIILKSGDTILWHPYTEISFSPKDSSLDEICILSNGFAHPTVSRKVKSATIPRLKP